MKKIAILTSHPVHYQTALFAEIAKEEELNTTVFFCWKIDKQYFDTEFNRRVDFNLPESIGARHHFLVNFSLAPSSKFFGQINPGIFFEIVFNKYDAVIVLGWNSFTNWLAFLAAFLSRTPVFLRGENPLNQENRGRNLKAKIKKIILSSLFKKISGFLYIGEQNKLFYEYYGVPENKLYFVPYAMDNKRLKSEYEMLRGHRQSIREKNGIMRDAKVILFVGKLIPKKRPEDLLRAFEMVNIKDKTLVFVGDGILSEHLQKIIAEKDINNVHFFGFKDQVELPEYYAMADVFVLPSGAGETWGLVVNEAMCFGLPIIVSDVVGCGPDLVTANNGLVYRCGDVGELRKSIEKLLSSEEGLVSFSRSSLEHIDKYSYNNDVVAIAQAIKEIKPKK